MLVRGGDLALVDQVRRLRGFQEELAAVGPENPRRLLGAQNLKTRTFWRPGPKNSNPLAPATQKVEPSGAPEAKTRTL